MLIEIQCIVANIDADDQKNKGIAERYGVKGYPTIKFFPAGSKEPVDYSGGRTVADFVNFLNEECGTNRAPEGGLNDKVRRATQHPYALHLPAFPLQAGRLPEFDVLAQKFFAAALDAKNTIYKEAKSLSEKVKGDAKNYVKVMDKIVNGSAEYIEKESKR